MPSWKKVLISGSDAALNKLTVINGITGSLFGTASYASGSVFTSTNPALSASYALTASHVIGGGGGGTTITTQDEGSPLSSTVTTLNFVGAGVVASGTGATTTVTITGGSGGSAFPFSGSAIITGSLLVSGSTTVTGSINVSGGQVNVDGVNVLDTALAYAIALG